MKLSYFVDFFSANLIWTEGAQILIVLVVMIIGALLWYRPIACVILGFLAFSFYFFRNPDRVCLAALHDDTVIVCPADGKVVAIKYDPLNALEGFAHKISIFLSPFDVHVNWLPAAGTVEEVIYKPGAFTFAFLPKSSELNERNDVRMVTTTGHPIMVRQIAGTIARRICCWVNKGQVVPLGHKFGMIRFGSRVDLFLPKEAVPAVGVGQVVYGGQTVIAHWR